MKRYAWILTADMGYGHHRAAYPLKDMAYLRIIDVNQDQLVPEVERKTWTKIQSSYEWVSRIKNAPLVGSSLFGLYDRAQSIAPLFPIRDLSKPTYWTKYTKKYIFKRKICEKLAEIISETRHPVVTTFPFIALALEYRGIKNKIYCVVTDSDLNRVWVAAEPKKSSIIYLAPCKHVVVRLKEYGVPDDRIIMTGFPLPKENIGGVTEKLLKEDIKCRLANLDPKKTFAKKNEPLVKKFLGGKIPPKSDHVLTISYLVGGAGAQRENGMYIAESLKTKILKNKICLNLVAGTRKSVFNYFTKKIEHLGLKKCVGKSLRVVYSDYKMEYFKLLNMYLRKTDIMWTKPSEMSFYTGLGIPVIMTNPLGSHEGFNKEWLEHMGSGIMESDPSYVSDWLHYWLESGRFAEAAFAGYTEALTRGAYNIEDVVLKKVKRTIFEK